VRPPEHRLTCQGTAWIHHRDAKDAEEEKPTSRLRILYNLERITDEPIPRSFVAFVHFVVSYSSDVGMNDKLPVGRAVPGAPQTAVNPGDDGAQGTARPTPDCSPYR